MTLPLRHMQSHDCEPAMQRIDPEDGTANVTGLRLSSTALMGSQTTLALEFSGAALTEQDIYALWGKNNCKPFMVNSASSKTAMPKVLADYLNSDASYREVKIITCKYKTVDIEFYLTQKKSGWTMFSGEAVTIPSRNSP